MAFNCHMLALKTSQTHRKGEENQSFHYVHSITLLCSSPCCTLPPNYGISKFHGIAFGMLFRCFLEWYHFGHSDWVICSVGSLGPKMSQKKPLSQSIINLWWTGSYITYGNYQFTYIGILHSYPCQDTHPSSCMMNHDVLWCVRHASSLQFFKHLLDWASGNSDNPQIMRQREWEFFLLAFPQ